jgi:hypothetical protein
MTQLTEADREAVEALIRKEFDLHPDIRLSVRHDRIANAILTYGARVRGACVEVVKKRRARYAIGLGAEAATIRMVCDRLIGELQATTKQPAREGDCDDSR